MAPLTTPTIRWKQAIRAIGVGGLSAGVLDITDALVFFGRLGVSPVRILQSIASGVLGASAFQGGWSTALLGLGLHFVIAFGAAAVYFFASRTISLLRNRPVISGLLYGGAVYLFMNYVVLPLSAVPKSTRPTPLFTLVNGILAVVCLVGLPIAFATRAASATDARLYRRDA